VTVDGAPAARLGKDSDDDGEMHLPSKQKGRHKISVEGRQHFHAKIDEFRHRIVLLSRRLENRGHCSPVLVGYPRSDSLQSHQFN
jgi:hypothetical protein